MIQNYSKIELGELLSNPDEIIARNAMSILKRLQSIDFKRGVKAEYATACNFNACKNTAIYYGVCEKHIKLEA